VSKFNTSGYLRLILEGGCVNDFYLPLAATEYELGVTILLRIRLADKEVKQNGVGRDAPNRMAYSENAVVFTIPYFAEPSK
jgi:hypothetical protein